VYWIGDARYASAPGQQGLFVRALRVEQRDPGNTETPRVVVPVVISLRSGVATQVPTPTRDDRGGWWPRDAFSDSHGLHAIWKENDAGPLLYARYDGVQWSAVEPIAGGDSLATRSLRGGGMLGTNDGLLFAAARKGVPRTSNGVAASVEWVVFERIDRAWRLLSVPTWKNDPLEIALTSGRQGQSLIALVHTIDGLVWAARLRGTRDARFIAGPADVPVGTFRPQMGLASTTLGDTTVLVTAMLPEPDKGSGLRAVLMVTKFSGGERIGIDSIVVAPDIADFGFSTDNETGTSVIALFSDGSAWMYATTARGATAADTSVRWRPVKLPGEKHMALPILHHDGNALRMYASEVLEKSSDDPSSGRAQGRAYILRCLSR
jgi:hypothetical protein